MKDMHTKTIRECVKELRTSITGGLSNEEAEKRLKIYGTNTLIEHKTKPFMIRLLNQFNDFMVIILIIASIISFFTELYSGEGFMDSIIIIAIVIINAVIGVVQESKAEKAISALKDLTAPECLVKRNGHYMEIKAEELVPGDVIKLSQGNIVPADCRLINAASLKVSEANLTGEAVPVDKNADESTDRDLPLGERKNMLYMGTSIALGRCEAMVCYTGMYTEMGKIAGMLKEEEETTPLQERLNRTGKLLGIGALAICFFIFIIGVLRKIPVFNMFMTSVSLAVAAIPEGLPAIVTIVLAIGTKKMAENRAVVRKLPAVEALGSANVICSDKTGTLTCNMMQVTEIEAENRKLALTLGAMCNDCEPFMGDFKGEPTEKALAKIADKESVNKADLDKLYPRINEFAFESSLKRMTTIHSYNNTIRCITKGALEKILPLCTHYATKDGTILMTNDLKNKIIAQNEAMGKKALRVIAVAYKDMEEEPKSREYGEYGLIYSGMMGLLDPPREEVTEAVAKCKKAGIRPVMITGDNGITAMAIAKKIGIDSDIAITGSELDKLDDKSLQTAIKGCSVFARVSPEHKVRLVKAFKAEGNTVAMTGDGVNDAPALKVADIGCAMGISGTDVAKGVADIVLTDDNFATIVEAVHQGRNIYENIKKAVHFLLSSNIGEIITIFIAMIMGFNSPLLPIQLLWVNLVTDSLPAIALGLDSCDSDIMERKPQRDLSLFSGGLWEKILLEGAMIGMLALLAFATGSVIYKNLAVGRTMAFAVLSISQLVHAFNMRSEHSLFDINPIDNKYLNLSLIIGVILQVSVIQLPFMSNLFKVNPLNSIQWLVVFMLCLMPIVIVELEKRFSK